MVLTAAAAKSTPPSVAASMPVRRRRRSRKEGGNGGGGAEPAKNTATTRRNSSKMQSSTSSASTAVAPHGGGQKGNNSKASLGLPSPTASETSDYQRSTPSPRNAAEDGGSLGDWSSSGGVARSNSSSSGGGGGGSARFDHDSDAGFSEDQRVPPLPSQQQQQEHSNSKDESSLTARLRSVRRPQRRSTFTSSSSSSSPSMDPRLTLQKVRVELEKIPSSGGVVDVSSTKRRHSADQDKDTIGAEKKRLKEEDQDPKVEALRSAPSLPLTDRRLLFAALRKAKLDEFLNLKANAVKREISLDEQDDGKSADSPPSVALENKTDLFLLSQLKQLNKDLGPKDPDQDKVDSSSSSSAVTPASTPSEDGATFSKPQATVIRFPVAASRGLSQQQQQQQQHQQQQQEGPVPCKWEGCTEEDLESEGKLLDHIRLCHAAAQNPEGKEDFQYKCLWRGCKVFGRGSSSRSWLEKHVAGHSGGKPFQCIVDGCKMRFGTQSLLARHVNSHFKKGDAASASSKGSSSSSSSGAVASSVGDDPDGQQDCQHNHNLPPPPPAAAVKQLRRAGKKMKYRKTLFSARIFDLFDSGVMARVKERLNTMEDTPSAANEFTFRSRVVARRRATPQEEEEEEEQQEAVTTRRAAAVAAKEENGGGGEGGDADRSTVMVLQRWIPENILPDSWCPLSRVEPTKTVRLHSLPPSARAALSSHLLSFEISPSAPFSPAKRKPGRTLPAHLRLS